MKADQASKLTGLETGADDYLTKPFDSEELMLVVHNRIKERKMLRELFQKNINLEPRQIALSSMDEKFIKTVMNIVDQHLEDSEFSIEEFSREAGYSQMQFYRKIKNLTGYTPSLFLRCMRLKRAALMLSKKSDNVSQIAYSVGFNSLSYFNKCFKEQYNTTPGEYAKANHNEN